MLKYFVGVGRNSKMKGMRGLKFIDPISLATILRRKENLSTFSCRRIHI